MSLDQTYRKFKNAFQAGVEMMSGLLVLLLFISWVAWSTYGVLELISHITEFASNCIIGG